MRMVPIDLRVWTKPAAPQSACRRPRPRCTQQHFSARARSRSRPGGSPACSAVTSTSLASTNAKVACCFTALAATDSSRRRTAISLASPTGSWMNDKTAPPQELRTDPRKHLSQSPACRRLPAPFRDLKIHTSSCILMNGAMASPRDTTNRRQHKGANYGKQRPKNLEEVPV